MKNIEFLAIKEKDNISWILSLFWITYKQYDSYMENISMLIWKEKWESITFTDFDETLYSRIPQFKSDERFLQNRWKKWIDLVYNVIWLENFLSTYYNPKFVVKEVLDRTNIILTAWQEELQRWKLLYTEIQNEAIVVYEHKLKPKAIIEKILFDLKYIPKEIIFIDDKAFELEEQFRYLSFLFQTKIILENISLDENEPTKVKNIEMKIFENGKEKD